MIGSSTYTNGPPRDIYGRQWCPNCGDGTCACYAAGLAQNSFGTTTIYYGATNNWPALEELKEAVEEAKFKQGWRLEVACSEEPKPAKPRAERRAAPAPRIVGGGPMRRRWR